MAKVTINGTTFPACYCGCEQPVPSGRMYRPGHDARHAGQVARYLARYLADANFETEDVDAMTNSTLSQLPTPALKAKARQHALRLVSKGKRKSKAPAVKADTEKRPERKGTAKIGRWTYPARTRGGAIERNSKRDGSGEWILFNGTGDQITWG